MISNTLRNIEYTIYGVNRQRFMEIRSASGPGGVDMRWFGR